MRLRIRAGTCNGGAHRPPTPALFTVVRMADGVPVSANHWFGTRRAAQAWTERQDEPNAWFVVPFLAA